MHKGINALLLTSSDSTTTQHLRIQNFEAWFTFYAIKSKPKQLFKFQVFCTNASYKLNDVDKNYTGLVVCL